MTGQSEPRLAVRIRRQDVSCLANRDWKTTADGMDRLDACRARFDAAATLFATCGTSTTFRSSRSHNVWDDTVSGRFADRQDLRRPDEHQGHRALPADDHRPRRPRPRPDLRHRHDRLRRRAVGPAVDHDRHEPRRARPRPHAADGRASTRTTCSPTRRGASRKEAELTGQAPPSPLPTATGDIRTGLRLQARAARHAQVDRQQPRHPGGHDAASEIDAAIARHAETETLYDQPYEDTQGRPRVRPVHRREPVARTASSSTGPRTTRRRAARPAADAGAVRRR